MRRRSTSSDANYSVCIYEHIARGVWVWDFQPCSRVSSLVLFAGYDSEYYLTSGYAMSVLELPWHLQTHHVPK